ncbi:hypothetical protein [Salinarimonas sp.]|uniref:hypothetical protein n=1 Tax=Salinarimonas sp. TaxID=2766526 RepID=UPI00391C39BA
MYVIFESATGHAVRIGQGDINDRLGRHFDDPAIPISGLLNPLAVTWARVDPRLVDGVERYLGDVLVPKVGSRFPNADPIAVNVPAGVVRGVPAGLGDLLEELARANPLVSYSAEPTIEARSPLSGLHLNTWPGRKTT